ARFAVERVHGHASRGILAVRRLDHVVLNVGAEAVLRAEDGAQPGAVVRCEAVHDVPEATVDRRVIADDADPRSAQPAGVEQNLGSESNHPPIMRSALKRTYGEQPRPMHKYFRQTSSDP